MSGYLSLFATYRESPKTLNALGEHRSHETEFVCTEVEVLCSPESLGPNTIALYKTSTTFSSDGSDEKVVSPGLANIAKIGNKNIGPNMDRSGPPCVSEGVGTVSGGKASPRGNGGAVRMTVPEVVSVNRESITVRCESGTERVKVS